MPSVFRPLTPLRGWRRVAAHAWRAPQDPSVYATLEIPMDGSLAYVEHEAVWQARQVLKERLGLASAAIRADRDAHDPASERLGGVEHAPVGRDIAR